jgi:hypothetical protein
MNALASEASNIEAWPAAAGPASRSTLNTVANVHSYCLVIVALLAEKSNNGSELVSRFVCWTTGTTRIFRWGVQEFLGDLKLRDRSVLGVVDGVALIYVGVYVV